MPFGKWASFDACVSDMQGPPNNYDLETAKATCGKLQSELGGGNFTGYEIDPKGELYLKYFLIDASLAQNTAAGDFSVSPEAIAANEQAAVGIPFVVLPSKDLSVFGDWHAWDPNPDATLEQHRAFAGKYAPGYLAAVTRESNLLAANDVKQNGGRFAIIHINDKRAKDAYLTNPSLIPRAVSPGIINRDAPNKYNIQNFDWAHLAAVPQGAFGKKATLYGSCLGPSNQCVNHLMAASVLEKAKETNYCPIGASENILRESISSLGFSEGNSSRMSANSSTETAQTTVPVPVQNSNIQASPPAQQGAPIAAVPQPEQQAKPVLRLKSQMQNQQVQTVDLKEHEKLRKEFEDYKLTQEQNARKEAIKKLIPTQLFIEKGKFDEAKYNAEVEKRASQGWDDETLSQHYSMALELWKAKQAPQVNPLGGSQEYISPSEAPLIGGSSVDGNDFVMTSVKELISRCIVGGNE